MPSAGRNAANIANATLRATIQGVFESPLDRLEAQSALACGERVELSFVVMGHGDAAHKRVMCCHAGCHVSFLSIGAAATHMNTGCKHRVRQRPPPFTPPLRPPLRTASTGHHHHHHHHRRRRRHHHHPCPCVASQGAGQQQPAEPQPVQSALEPEPGCCLVFPVSQGWWLPTLHPDRWRPHKRWPKPAQVAVATRRPELPHSNCPSHQRLLP